MNKYEVMTNKEFNKLICQRILSLRKERKLTLEQLAYQSGISKGGLSEILNGKKCPSPFTIAKICSGLNLTIKEFYSLKEFDDFVESL